MTPTSPGRGAVVLAESGPGGQGREPARLGRKRDHSRDGVILQAALDVVAEVGYAGMTMDMVAARAKAGKATVYRRWSSKEEMVLEAVARTRPGQPLDELPDTGTLRGDLLALFKPQTQAETEKRMQVMAGLASMVTTHPAFDEAVNDTMVAPWAEAYRALIQRKPFEPDFLTSWIDGVVLPALHCGVSSD